MNWAKTNKLLAGFLAFVLIGVLVLGGLLFAAYGAFSRTSAAYGDQARELNRLQSLKPFPSSENLAKEAEQKEAFAGKILALQKALIEKGEPLVPLTPEQFQNKLREAVSRVTARAAEQKVKLPDDFYLGFSDYRDALPIGEAASALGRQLEAIENIVMVFLDNRVDSIGVISRQPVPEESGSQEGEKSGEQEVVKRNPLTISMTGNRSALHNLINTEVSGPTFYILRLMFAQNEELKGPSREISEPGAEASGAQAPGEGKERIELLVGDEKVSATFEIEIVEFAGAESEEGAAE